MKSVIGAVVILIIMGFSVPANAVVFKAVASSTDNHYSAGTTTFGHYSVNIERAWSTLSTDYAAVAVWPDRRDSIFLSTLDYFTFDLMIWTSPSWTHGNVLLTIWAEDVSPPRNNWWDLRVYSGHVYSCSGTFTANEITSPQHPFAALTFAPASFQNPAIIRITQNPEPSSIVGLISGLLGFVVISSRRRSSC